MCGICGIFGVIGDDEQACVAAMMRRLAHRGPDGEGITSGGGFVIGHKRLAIIDVEHGRQPMRSEDERYTLVFNGEIYNYLELRQRLIEQGEHFQTHSDTEVLLKLLIREGEDCLSRIIGMFAFAFVDGASGEWFLARDQFGIKPLYYTHVGEQVLFASEIKALLAYPGVRRALNWQGFQQYLTFQFCLNGATLFDGIHKVEPGCYLRGRGGAITQRVRYWDTNFLIDEHRTEQYFVDRLSNLLEESVRLQIRSDVPVGAYLSGGLDSSAIVMLASKHLHHNLKVFHGRFEDGPEYDESQYAHIVAEASGSELHVDTSGPREFCDDLPRLIHAMDEPLAGPGLFPQYRVSRMAARQVKVVLGGQGGDEVFGGYARYLIGYLEQALKGAIFETQEEGRHLVSLASIIPNMPLLRQYQPLMQQFWHDGLFEEMDARYFRLIDRSPDLDHLLTRDSYARFDRASVYEEFQAIFNHPDTRSYFNKMTHFDLKTLLPALLHVEDRVSMAVSLESRVPLLDTRIVDLVTSMPPQMKFKGGRAKHIFKKALETFVPEAILQRKDKMGFPVPLSKWMVGGPVREFVSDTLLGRKSRERGLFEPRALENLINSEAPFGRQLWGALCLELWHQQFLDG
jgi:asparagine synthase (glutamine-hydrolysing)